MSEIFESKWSETKQALTEGLEGNKKKTMDVVLENTKRYGQYKPSNSLTVHHGSNYCANTSLF